MQRLTAILFAMFVLQLTASAGETPGEFTTTVGAQVGDVFPHFGNNFGGSRSVEPGSRLIAKAYFIYKGSSFAPIDSAVYIYGGNRGGSPSIDDPNKDDHILFDHSYVYIYNSTFQSYGNATHREQQFDINNRVERLTYQDWSIPAMSWKNKERYIYTYGSDGKMQASTLQQWYANMWTNNINSILTYDADNRVTTMKSTTYNVEFDYDANTKNLNYIIDKNWNNGTQTWDNSERKSYKYNTNDDVIEYTHEEWDANTNSWILLESWRYTYGGSTGKDLTECEQLLWNGSKWTPNKKYTYAYQGGNQVQDIEYVWSMGINAYAENKKTTRTYNSYNQPEVFKTYSWSVNGWIHVEGDEEIHYYYEKYDPTSVPQFLAHTPEMKVYPVPASSNVFVEFEPEQMQDISIHLTDMTGKTVYIAQDRAYNTYKQQIDVSNLVSGNYILTVNGSEGLRMNKRINVTH